MPVRTESQIEDFLRDVSNALREFTRLGTPKGDFVIAARGESFARWLKRQSRDGHGDWISLGRGGMPRRREDIECDGGIRAVEFRALFDPTIDRGDLFGRQRIILLRHTIVFVFGGVINALGMTAPARTAEQVLAQVFGARSEGPVLAALFAVALVIVPLAMLAGAGAATAWLTGRRISSALDVASRYSYALVPLGFGVWLAHYGFHLLTGVLTIVPVMQSAAVDLLGWAALGTPLWQLTGMRPGLVFPFEVGVILTGAAGSFVLAYLISERDHRLKPVAATIPWAFVIVVITTAALWITAQPMDMRAVAFPG